MKKIYLIILGLFFLALPSQVSASSANVSISANSTVMLNNSVTVTVNITSSNKMGSWQIDLGYDKNYLKLTSSTAEGNGTYMVASAPGGTKSKKYTFTFKTLKAGSTKLSINSLVIYDYDDVGKTLSATPSSKTINIKTKEEIEASYSANAYLKSITVGNYQLNPSFSKDVKEYNVEVENEVENITIGATKEDNTASVTGLGEKVLTEGNNKFEIVVTAQKGNTLTYVVNVLRKELHPIEVSILDEGYTIVRKVDALTQYSSFKPTTIDYEGEEIPALVNESANITLIGLKDSDGNILMFVYDGVEIGDSYVEIKPNGGTLYPLELKTDDRFKNYQIKEIVINEKSVSAYVHENSKNYAIIYAKNMETGENNYYSYYISDGSTQVYNDDLIVVYENRITNYKYVLFGLIGFIILLLLFIIVRKPGKKNKNKEVISE